MKQQLKQIKLSEIVFDETIYPRSEHNPSKVQEYKDNLESIESKENFIIVDSRYKLLDGRHRHLAYLTKADGKDIEIKVYVREDVKDDKIALIESIKYNSQHGQQLSQKDKKRMALYLYTHGYTIDTISKELSITERTVRDATEDVRKREKEERKEKIFNLYLACHTQEEIAESLNLEKMTISREIEDCNNLENFPKSYKLSANHESDFETPLYNIWSFAKKTNEVEHFGNTEVRIVDNLLYLYTKPFDIVVDPFAGGGSTIDVCKKRLRRYFVSDRKPIEARKHEIRKLDITESLPELNKRWNDVSLVYLDPPYWKQAENQYSKDKEDLANQTLEDFNNNLSSVINKFGSKLKSGSHIALIIQPTQWKSESKNFTDHVFDMIKLCNGKKLNLKTRISCPYSTQQCTPQQVQWAKDNKELLVLTRELVIWQVK